MREVIRDKGRLEHMLQSINVLLDHRDGLTLENIRRDEVFYFGLVKHLEIIGEAAYKLTNAFRNSHPQTPWRQIISMRHVMVHGYFQISEKQVYYAIVDDLMSLKNQVIDYLSNTDWVSWSQATAE